MQRFAPLAAAREGIVGVVGGGERDRLRTDVLAGFSPRCPTALQPAAVVPLRVPIGSVVLWRSSLLHAVAPHRSEHWRLHLMFR